MTRARRARRRPARPSTLHHRHHVGRRAGEEQLVGRAQLVGGERLLARRRSRARAASSSTTSRVTPARMRWRQRVRPQHAVDHREHLRVRPLGDHAVAHEAPPRTRRPSVAACLASTLGSRFTVLRSHRPQRMSGCVTHADAARAQRVGRGERAGAGDRPSAASRRAGTGACAARAPRVTCKYTVASPSVEPVLGAAAARQTAASVVRPARGSGERERGGAVAAAARSVAAPTSNSRPSNGARDLVDAVAEEEAAVVHGEARLAPWDECRRSGRPASPGSGSEGGMRAIVAEDAADARGRGCGFGRMGRIHASFSVASRCRRRTCRR